MASPRHGKVKVNFDSSVKSDSMVGVGVLCRDERDVVLLAKDWPLARLSASLTKLSVIRKAIHVACFELHI